MDAAYRVWGREFYLNTSLNRIASELGVSKQALYRHFRSKQALLDAMTRYFFDDFAAFIQADYEKALKSEDDGDRIFILIRSVAEYFARNVYFFIFSMTMLHERKMDSFNLLEELCMRGIDFEFFHRHIGKNRDNKPLVMRLIFVTLTFFMAGFFKRGKSSPVIGDIKHSPTEAAISKIIDVIGEITGRGLGYTSEEIDILDYEGLESRITGMVNSIVDDPLLKAVAGAVAEAGPWEASMEQVARRSGLAKSSLYCHFKSRQDMLYQLFKTEFMRISDFAKLGMRQSEVPQEQLYLGIFSIAEYLRSKTDILVALDWIRNRRLDFSPPDGKHKKPPGDFMRLFDGIDIKPLQNSENPFREILTGEKENSAISPWILFLIVNTLINKNPEQMLGDVPNSDIRLLYRFATLGIGGFKTSEK